MRNDLKALGVGLLTTVALSAAVAAAQQDRAPWALGMSPTFSGRIPNWAQAAAKGFISGFKPFPFVPAPLASG